MTLPYAFVPGWTPDLADRGRAAFFASGRTFFTGPQFIGDDRPLPPGYSMSGFLKWPYDQGQVGSCFPADTLVLMDDGSQVGIAEVRVGNKVRTAEGNVGRVTATMSRWAEEVVALRLPGQLYDEYAIRATPEHPFLTLHGYKPILELDPDDDRLIRRSKRSPDLSYHVAFSGLLRMGFGGNGIPVFNLEVEGDNSYVANGFCVHNCFANMGAVVLQLMMLGTTANKIYAASLLNLPQIVADLRARYDDTSEGSAFNPSRALIWYQCRKLDGSLGSGSDGGSIVNTFAALGDAPRGVGDCSEELWPYKPSHAWLERTPSADVLTKAGETRIEHIAETPFNVDAWKRSIFNLSPIGIGIYWPSGWDSSCDHFGRITGIGGGGYGHALAVIGWVDQWDGHRWWEIQNSHGPIYGTPPAEVAAAITGYKPSAGDKSFSFWAREDWFQEVLGYHNTETYNAADVHGFMPRPINTPTSFHSAGKWS